MAFDYVPQRERWRTAMLLAWKKGDLRQLRCASLIQRICEYAAPEWPRDPLRKLTVNLINTYTGINESYYEAKRKWNGNFMWRSGQELVLNDRYELKNQIGNGAFGVVMHAIDLETGESVAIKIIKARPAYTSQSQREIKLLQSLRTLDTENTSHVVELRSHFMHHGHQCLVFEMLSANLYTLLERVNFHGFSLPLVRKFAEQLLVSLQFLAREDVRVIHTDIKPENVCIRNPKRSAIKLVDFGSSCSEGQRLFSYIQSRYYRSPEVLLGLDYTVAIDMWSLACVLVEMHTGKPLFSGESQEDQFDKIIAVRGLPPDSMIDAAPSRTRDQFFVPVPAGNGRRWIARRVLPMRSLTDILGMHSGGPDGRWQDEPGHTEHHYECFLNLIDRMLTYDPNHRITPTEALQHKFITMSKRPSAAKAADAATATNSGGAQARPNLFPYATAARHAHAHAHSSHDHGHQSMDVSDAGGGGKAVMVAAAAAVASVRGGGGGRRPVSNDVRGPSAHISQQHQSELSTALHAIGCPEALVAEVAFTWESIRDLLMRFTQMDDRTLGEARELFSLFVSQPLRKRRDMALQEFLLLLREQAALGHLANDPMAVDNSSSPAP